MEHSLLPDGFLLVRAYFFEIIDEFFAVLQVDSEHTHFVDYLTEDLSHFLHDFNLVLVLDVEIVEYARNEVVLDFLWTEMVEYFADCLNSI